MNEEVGTIDTIIVLLGLGSRYSDMCRLVMMIGLLRRVIEVMRH